MKKVLLFLCALVPFMANAQDLRIIDRIDASSEGMMLSLEDATNGRGVRPAPGMFNWTPDGQLVTRTRDGFRSISLTDGSESAYDHPRSGILIPPKGAFGQVSEAGRSAYVLDGAIYVIDGSQPRLVAKGEGDIVVGTSVSRNEFGINRGLFWSPGAAKLAFYRKDESLVSSFPLLNIKKGNGTLRMIKYPMNGETSEKISLGIYDVGSGSVVYVEPEDFGYDRYLSCISWDPSSSHVFIQVLDRSQHHMRLNMYDASDGSFVRTILTEDNDAWVEPWEPLHFINDGLFIYSTDNRDGYKSLYLCDLSGNVKRLASCNADVQFYAYLDGDLYYTSAEVSPIENHLFKIQIRLPKNGRFDKIRVSAPVRLTNERGWHDVAMSPDCKYFIDRYSNFSFPGAVVLKKNDGTVVKELFRAPDPIENTVHGEIRLGIAPGADPAFDNYYRLFLPAGFDPAKKYPLIVYVYGGPHSQMVRDTWLGGIRPLEMYWAQQGYVVYVQDNRGTSNRGAAFEKAINRQCGQAEMADQMAGISELLKEPWVDAERVGVHGWSYGGFMTISLMTNYPEVFKAGVAGGPVIDWKWYEIMYGERYMDTVETNPEGFARTSLIGKAGDLKGKLLICQGAVDNTVVWEHSLSFVQECIEKGIQLDYFPYPCSEHNVAGPWRVHLNKKIVSYFEDNL